MTSSPRPWQRIFAEFVAITAGVFLGLLADDYRGYRAERATEREYVDLFEQDLDRDLESLKVTRGWLENHANGALTIRRAVGHADIHSDSFDRALSVMFFTNTYDWRRSTFVSLRDGAGLHVIEDPSLRSTLTDYYEVSQVGLQAYIADYRMAHQRLRLWLGRHVRFMPVEEFDELWPLPEDMSLARLHSPLAELQQDIEFLNDVTEVGARSFELLEEIERMAAENRMLRNVLAAQRR
jgi:hypothetical protein